MKQKIIMVVCCVLLMASCVTTEKTLYSWYDSEDAAYQYQKKATDKSLDKAMSEYLKVLEKQKGTRKVVPPGINAEYGFMLVKSGKVDQGIEYLKKEVSLYPESEIYISRIIKQLEQ